MDFHLNISSKFLAYSYMIITGLAMLSVLGLGFSNITDQHALISFKDQIQADPFNVLQLWNTSTHFCHWHGIRCNNQRVTVVDLSSLELTGSLSLSVANLSFLTTLILANNSFYGFIPMEILQLPRLHSLVLYNNSFQGEFSGNFTYSTNLRVLDVRKNNISGCIPPELGSMSSLLELHLSANRFLGMIPPSLGNLSALHTLSLSENNLEGRIPDEFGLLSNLVFLELSSNNLSGTVPQSLYNLSSLQYFLLASNHLQGTFPPHLGFTLPKLRRIYVRGNQFTGQIPQSLVANASQLEQLDIGINAFTGTIPSGLENHQNLLVLHFDSNLFGGALPVSITNLSRKLVSLRLDHNLLSGVVPEALGNLINLENLALSENMFTGEIPYSIGKLTKLQGIRMFRNNFSGFIPSSIGKISLLSILSLRENLLKGSIPDSLSNCTHLQLLDLSHNQLNGAIPTSIFLTLSSLSLGLNLASNQLSGPLPIEVGALGVSVGRLDISNNRLSGRLPLSLPSVEFLFMQGNQFDGTIPISVIGRAIRVLDLSRNNFSGQIPQFLTVFPFIEYLNLSFNKLEGEVPMTGVFSEFSAFSIVGNKRLCGGLKSLQLPSCPKVGTAKKKKNFLLAIIISSTFIFMIGICIYLVCVRKRILKAFKTKVSKATESPLGKQYPKVSKATESPLGKQYPKLTYADLFQATEGFLEENVIGKGRYSCVYVGKLGSIEQKVAVKVLNLEQRGAKKSFNAECEVLRNIRHRNLVKIITAYSGSDFEGKSFKALVYEFLPNGSLESWIHPNPSDSKFLSLTERLNVAFDVASALHYLHNCCDIPIVHRDLKPNNIFLDDELCAHVGDFGLARFLLASAERSKRLSAMSVAGTVGYIALEYGVGGPVSTLADMYSYGILMLEMFTGRRPTHESFQDDFSLHNYVKNSLPEQVMTVIDPVLILESELSSNKLEECLTSILQIGLTCSARSPLERMDAEDVLMELNNIRIKF